MFSVQWSSEQISWFVDDNFYIQRFDAGDSNRRSSMSINHKSSSISSGIVRFSGVVRAVGVAGVVDNTNNGEQSFY